MLLLFLLRVSLSLDDSFPVCRGSSMMLGAGEEEILSREVVVGEGEVVVGEGEVMEGIGEVVVEVIVGEEMGVGEEVVMLVGTDVVPAVEVMDRHGSVTITSAISCSGSGNKNNCRVSI